MGELKTANVGAIVKRFNETYQAGGKCTKADADTMVRILKDLRGYTDQVQAEADDEGLTDDSNIPQWANDLAAWRERLAAMEATAAAAKLRAGPASCSEIYNDVVGPLLDGRYDKARVTTGIVNPAVPSVPDIATPYILGNQVVVYREFQDTRFEAFIQYWIDEAKALGRKVMNTAKRAAPSFLKIGVGIAVAAIGVSLAINSAKSDVKRS